MAVDERDPHTGHKTTGHEWNGIKELNTPVPRPVWFFLAVTGLFSIIYWILMPAWPAGATYTKGLLGVSDGQRVRAQREQGAAARAGWLAQVEATPYERLLTDPAMLERVRKDGAQLFGDNCAACHGADGRGTKGFPSLADRDWLWGGKPETVAETIRVGVNSGHPESRASEMLAFGATGILEPTQVANVADYVMSLSVPVFAQSKPNSVRAGRAVFDGNCVVCHGAEGRGNQELGAPNLTDPAWINGSDWTSVYTVVTHGRKGEMPSWEGRLSPAERKLLAAYVLDLVSRPQ
ncbi:MAG TPA: cytochrome-c oxidase, cbb3-type subunit III [Croceibacterium sp.]